MMFYTCVSGWMLRYFVDTASGKFEGLDAKGVENYFGGMLGDPITLIIYTAIVIIFGFVVAAVSFFITYFFLASFSGATRENMSFFSFWRAIQMPGFYLYSIFYHLSKTLYCTIVISENCTQTFSTLPTFDCHIAPNFI